MNAENMYDAWDNGDRHEIRQQLAKRNCPVCVASDALRERLAQPQRTHWEGCEEVHPECKETRRRDWVGLTRDEVLDIEETHPLAFYRAIEAKLKEKNNG